MGPPGGEASERTVAARSGLYEPLAALDHRADYAQHFIHAMGIVAGQHALDGGSLVQHVMLEAGSQPGRVQAPRVLADRAAKDDARTAIDDWNDRIGNPAADVVEINVHT